MKAKIYLFTLLLIGSLLVSCKKDIEYNSDFNKSNKAWTNFKISSNNSYRYVVTFTSWAGFSTETTITVRNGKVVGRSYVRKEMIAPQPTIVVREEWEENESNLNSHKWVAGEAVTLDVVYLKAKTEWLIKRKDATVYFEAKNNGMISSAGYVPNGCQDDCFHGIRIGRIEKL